MNSYRMKNAAMYEKIIGIVSFHYHFYEMTYPHQFRCRVVAFLARLDAQVGGASPMYS